VAGIYAVEGTFNSFAPSLASFSGTLTLRQANRNTAPLTGESNIVIQISGVASTARTVERIGLTEDGALSFDVRTAAGTAWRFNGTVTGRSITGSHVLPGSTQDFVGRWTGTR
jgi:hypothetical protein